MSEPILIQGGMGVGVSGWRLARAVARTGQLGVVSGTALDVTLARRLQEGDPGGHLRQALAHFPVAAIADRVLGRYFIPGGAEPGAPYRPVPRLGLRPSRARDELTVVANFAEVLLAKQGHAGPVGVNYLEKIQMATPAAVYGALLAGVDYVLMGAGIPAEIPRLLDELAAHRPGQVTVTVAGAGDAVHTVGLDPRTLLGRSMPPLTRPRLLAIVSAHVLAAYLARSAFALCRESRLDGELRQRLLREAADGTLRVRNDPLASPTGFPFKVADLPGTLSDTLVYDERPRLCDTSCERRPDERRTARPAPARSR